MNMLTKTTLAAVMLAAMAVSAQAQQQGKTRQIQVLAAPGAQIAAAPAADQAPADLKPEVAQVNPAPAPEVVAPKAELAPAPAPEPKVSDSEGRAEIRCADHREAGPQSLRLFRIRPPRPELPLIGSR